MSKYCVYFSNCWSFCSFGAFGLLCTCYMHIIEKKNSKNHSLVTKCSKYDNTCNKNTLFFFIKINFSFTSSIYIMGNTVICCILNVCTMPSRKNVVRSEQKIQGLSSSAFACYFWCWNDEVLLRILSVSEYSKRGSSTGCLAGESRRKGDWHAATKLKTNTCVVKIR